MFKYSVCGVLCNEECHAFGKECAGCNVIKGKVSWAKYLGKDICPIYQCIENRGLNNCGECSDMPCDIWMIETKNPEVTIADYEADLKQRMRNLRTLNKK